MARLSAINLKHSLVSKSSVANEVNVILGYAKAIQVWDFWLKNAFVHSLSQRAVIRDVQNDFEPPLSMEMQYLRPDAESNHGNRSNEELMKNAATSYAGYFVVPKVIES